MFFGRAAWDQYLVTEDASGPPLKSRSRSLTHLHSSSCSIFRERAGDTIAYKQADLGGVFEIEKLLLRSVGDFQIAINPDPWTSVFVYETQTTSDQQQSNFDYMDDPTSGVVAIRAGCRGFIGFVLDGGFMAQRTAYFETAKQSQPLNPAQFRELAAVAYTWGMRLRNRNVSIEWSRSATTLRATAHVDIPKEADLGPDQDILANRLAFAWGRAVSQVRKGNQFLTTLSDKSGPLHLSFYDEVI